MATKSRSALAADIASLFADNTGGEITALDLRTFLTDLLDSSAVQNQDSVTTLTDVTDAGSGAIISNSERTKLSGIGSGAEQNVQSDWNQTNTNQDSFILNKPVYGTEFSSASTTTVSSTTSEPSNGSNITTGTFPEQYLTLTTGSLPTGDYQLTVSYSWSGNSNGDDFLARVNRNSGAELFGFHRQEPQDSSGSGGDTPSGSGTNQRHWVTYDKILSNLSGAQTFDLEFASGDNGTTVSMISADLIFKRVN